MTMIDQSVLPEIPRLVNARLKDLHRSHIQDSRSGKVAEVAWNIQTVVECVMVFVRSLRGHTMDAQEID